MKRVLLCLCIVLPMTARAQDSINPYNAGQHANIYLQNTDIYYSPYRPPATTDTRAQLSCIASELRDGNGPRHELDYAPMTNGHLLSDDIGANALWMRLFTAARKPDGSASDIVAGAYVTSDTAHTNGHHGPDTIRANEDVDFRATGTIKIENGFHVKPGAFFHAYIEPHWTGSCATSGDSGNHLVFCDEFADSALTKWHVANGYTKWVVGGSNCAFDSNIVTRFSDTAAEDGYALRLDLKHDTCNCMTQDWQILPSSDTNFAGQHHTGCDEIDYWDPTKYPHGIHNTFPYSTGSVITCPWPYKSDSYPLQFVYQNYPYGRYEVREKVPHVLHHENNYGSAEGNEWNLDECMEGGNFALIRPFLSRLFNYGPFQGKFKKRYNGDTIFLSSGAHFSKYNNPKNIIINGTLYSCHLDWTAAKDTVVFYATTQREGGIPAALLSAPDSLAFYYERTTDNISDSLPWSVSADGKYFSGPFGISASGDSLYFSRSYQPTSIGLHVLEGDTTIPCTWNADSSKVMLQRTFPSLWHHNGFKITYTMDEGPAYPMPDLPMDTSGYKYHTYTMELLPHECEYLVDDVVVMRFPDRLVPVDDIRYDYVSGYPRVAIPFHIGELEIDGGSTPDSTENAFFLNNKSNCLGCKDNAAHGLIDYVRVWDLPQGYIVGPIKP